MAAWHWGWVEEGTVVRRSIFEASQRLKVTVPQCLLHFTHSDTREDGRHRFLPSCCSHKNLLRNHQGGQASQQNSLKEVLFQPEKKPVMSWAVVVHALSQPSGGRGKPEFEVRVVYRASSRAARATQRAPVFIEKQSEASSGTGKMVWP